MGDKKKKKSDNEVKIVLALNERGAPVIRFQHNANSESLHQQILGVLIKSCNSHACTLQLEKGSQFGDGNVEYEIKVQGT